MWCIFLLEWNDIQIVLLNRMVSGRLGVALFNGWQKLKRYLCVDAANVLSKGNSLHKMEELAHEMNAIRLMQQFPFAALSQRPIECSPSFHPFYIDLLNQRLRLCHHSPPSLMSQTEPVLFVVAT
jgi:hypothetical protein